MPSSYSHLRIAGGDTETQAGVPAQVAAFSGWVVLIGAALFLPGVRRPIRLIALLMAGVLAIVGSQFLW